MVITDPHIKQSPFYPVYMNGKGLEAQTDPDGVMRTSVFVKSQYMIPFVGQCWPGQSVWIDFLNSRGREYWASLYAYSFFAGTDSNFHVWIDMNEPSVFSGPEGTMPKTNRHVLPMHEPLQVLHRDVHNVYGLFMTMATH